MPADAPADTLLKSRTPRTAEQKAARRAAKAARGDLPGEGKAERATRRAAKAQPAAPATPGPDVPTFPSTLPRKKLDFIVAGTARSGTTAVGNYLSAVPQIHCANEVFPWSLDHSTLIAPECFTDRLPNLGDNPKKAKKVSKFMGSARDIQRKADTLTLYGSKVPMYIHRLAEVTQEIGQPVAIVTTRALRPVALSYYRRAADPSDKFSAGRTGLYAAGDYLMLAHVLAQAPARNVLLVPHLALTKDWEATMRGVVGFIAPGMRFDFDKPAIDRIHKRYEEIKARPARDEVALTEYEDAIVSEVEAMGIDPLLSRDVPFLVGEVQAQLRQLVRDLPPLIPWVTERAKNHPIPEARAFLADKWLNMATTGWSHLYGKPA